MKETKLSNSLHTCATYFELLSNIRSMNIYPWLEWGLGEEKIGSKHNDDKSNWSKEVGKRIKDRKKREKERKKERERERERSKYSS